MDQQRFDDLARLLGASGTRRAGIRAALGGLLGLGAGSVALEADAKRGRHSDADAGKKHRKRKETCKPACTDGFECVKVGKKRECQCPTGVTCGDACCRIGQVCEGGQCVAEPEPVQCIPAGDPCKSVGLPCCAGRTCASGQGGEADIACYVPKTGACTATADCVYGMLCQGGRCAPPAPVEGLGVACDAAAQQLCTTPGAVCTAYTGTGGPGGTYCTLPLQKTCTGDPDCTCYKCWYSSATVQTRASGNTKACCHQPGESCAVEQDCCLGLSCVNGTCGGTICVPEGGDCTAVGCCGTLTCNGSKVCSSGPTCAEVGASCASDRCCAGMSCDSSICTVCPTCVDSDQICQAGTTQAACGASGGACVSCTGGVRCCVTGICTAPTSYPNYNFPNPPNYNIVDQPFDVVMTSDGLEAISTSFAGGNFNGNLVPVWTRSDTTPNTWNYSYNINLGNATKRAWGLWLSPDAKTLYVAENFTNKVTVWQRPSVGTSNNWVVQPSSEVGGASQPTAIVVSPDQLTIYVAILGPAGIKVFTRTAIGQPWTEQSSWSDLSVITSPKGLAVSADGLTAWLSEGTAPGNEFHNIVILTRPSTSASFTWTGGEIDTDLTPVRGLWLSPDELTLYVTAGRQDGKVQIWTRSSTAVQDWQKATSVPSYNLDFGSYAYGGGVAVTPSGANMLVAVPGATRIYGIDPVCS